MGIIIIIFIYENGHGRAEPTFLSPTQIKPVLNFKGPYLAQSTFTRSQPTICQRTMPISMRIFGKINY